MLHTITKVSLLLSISLPATAQEYTLGPDSQPQPNVPQGKVTKHTWSKIFPGTVRDYWVYIPAQYNASTGRNPSLLKM